MLICMCIHAHKNIVTERRIIGLKREIIMTLGKSGIKSLNLRAECLYGLFETALSTPFSNTSKLTDVLF